MYRAVAPWRAIRRTGGRWQAGRTARALAAVVPMLAAALITVADGPAPASAVVMPPGGSQPAGAQQPPFERSLAKPVRHRPADLLIVSRNSLPAGEAAAVGRLPGVVAAQSVDAAQVKVDGKFAAVLGVDPVAFRAFAARPTASSRSLWRSVAGGGIAVSYTMGIEDRLPAGGTVRVAGRRTLGLPVGGFGTVGIGGIDAVISHSVARSLGFPAGNAIVVSAPHARPGKLRSRLRALLPRGTSVQLLAGPALGARQAAAGSRRPPAQARGAGRTRAAAAGVALTRAQTATMLRAALSRVGMPYIWGAAGPRAFDCSGLVQWAFARAGVVMPRVAADQARTGPAVSQLRPGDLLFYRTDPTAPGYISHVAIYLGNGKMIQAPQPGMQVQVVPADLGSEFAGAVAVAPVLAARAAAAPVG